MKTWKRFSTHFYSFTNRIFSSACLQVLSTATYWFAIYQSFLLVYVSLLLISVTSPVVSTRLPVIVKTTASEICAEIRCAIKIVIAVKPTFPAIDGILISVQGSTSYSKLGLKSGYNHFESSLTSYSITMFQTEIRAKRYKTLISGIYTLQQELQYAFRELFPGMKRVENIVDDLLVNFKKGFYCNCTQCYYIKPQGVFIF